MLNPKLQQMLVDTFQTELQETHQFLITALLALGTISTPSTLDSTLKELFRYSHNIKGAAISASIPAISSIAHGLEDTFEAWRTQVHFPSREEVDACMEVADNLLFALKMANVGERIDVESFLAPLKEGKALHKIPASEVPTYLKLSLSQVERANAKANEFIIYSLKLTNWCKALELSLKEIHDIPLLQSYPSLLTRMDNIATENAQFLGEFFRAVQSLHDELKAMRMLPVSTLFLPLSRTVREISAVLHKSVELEIRGGDIELDKAILDVIKDPLQHLVRNAIDHGIEDDTERQKAHKAIPAKLKIEVTQSAGKIRLKVIDDGRGIDVIKVKQHAIKMKLYSEKEIDNMCKEEILDCLFASGFSLHEGVTEISGRGVGLDVVKTELQKIKATVAIQTQEHQGTTFILTLPLTLATTRGVFFTLKQQTFMVPTLALKALYAIKTEELQWVNNHLSYVINHKPIPIVSLYSVLTNQEEPLELHRTCYGLLMDYIGVEIILWVDTILNEHDCVIKPLPLPFAELSQYIGITLTGDNTLVLVLEPSRLIEFALTKTCWQRPREPIVSVQVPLGKKVLIVDNAIATRSLCANALEAAQFHTSTAVDGKKAWELIQSNAFDCIITDITLPGLDGFALTKLVKSRKEYAHIPIILVSPFYSSKEEARGLEVGANAFLVKTEFDTYSLIETMESLL